MDKPHVAAAPVPVKAPKDKKPWHAPRLEHIGSVKEITLGGTKGHLEIGGHHSRG